MKSLIPFSVFTTFLIAGIEIESSAQTWNSSPTSVYTAGNVGIGNTNPTAKLHITGTGSTSATTSLLIKNSGGLQTFTVLDNGHAGVGINNVFKKDITKLGIKSASTDATGSTIVMERVHSGGAGADVLVGAVYYQTGQPNGSLYGTSGVEGHALAGDQLDLRFFTSVGNPFERMRITPDGNVGIGTTTPGTRLEINSGTSGQSGLRISSLTSAMTPAAANNRALSVDGQGNVILVPSGANSFWDVSPIGAGNIKNNNTGAVIVGTVNTLPAGFKLYVSSGILTERVKVALVGSSFWPDYVFDKNYKLKSLDEVESFINKNKHLPGVASAQELLNSGGIDVNEMFAKQMEKIEELTLYIIEQNKKIRCLEEKLNGEVNNN